MVIIQGAQYAIAFTIKTKNGQTITDENVDGVRIALGNQVATYPDGALTYSAEDGAWLFPMTQTNSRALKGQTTGYQCEIRINDEIFPSPIQAVEIKDSMFRERWDWS